MKYHLFLLLLPFVSISYADEFDPQTYEVSNELHNVLNQGLCNNNNIKASDLLVDDAEWNKRALYSDLYPKLQISGNNYRVKRETTYDSVDLTESNKGNSKSLNMVLSQKVFDGGVTFSKIQAAEMKRKSLIFENKQTIIDTMLKISNVYYDIKLEEQVISIREKGISQNQALLEIAQERYRNGVGTLIDISIAKSRLAKAELQFQQEKTKLEQNRMQLKSLLGKHNESSNCKVQLTYKQNLQLPNANIVLNNPLDFSPTVNALDAKYKANKYQLQAIKRSLLPTVNFTATHSLDTNSQYESFGQKTDAWYVGFNFNFNIFDGLSTYSQMHATSISGDVAKTNLAESIEQFKTEIEIAYNALESNYKTYYLSKNILLQNNQSFEGTVIKFKAGIGSLTDALLSQNDLIDSQISVVSIKNNILKEKGELMAKLLLFNDPELFEPTKPN